MSEKQEKLFGTDGVRGVPGQYPLTGGMVLKIGLSLCRYLLRKNSAQGPSLKVFIGKDTRSSGDWIETILSDVFTSSGIDVFLAGVIPAPGLAFLVRRDRADLGIMISASHNRPQDNGMKLFSAGGNKVSAADEETIEAMVFDNLVQGGSNLISAEKGKVCRVEDLRRDYCDFLKSAVAPFDIGGMALCFDLNWGATSCFARDVFSALGAEVYTTNDLPRGQTINNPGHGGYTRFKAMVLSRRAAAGFIFDGDGDRVSAIDERGGLLDGDDILGILAKYFLACGRLSGNGVAVSEMSNSGLKASLEKIGVRVVTARVGDKHVLSALTENNFNLGGEYSGQVILPEHSSTPDGMLAALYLLKAMRQSGEPLSVLARAIERVPQAMRNIAVPAGFNLNTVAGLKPAIENFELSAAAGVKIFLRHSQTEEVIRLKVEAGAQGAADNLADDLSELIRGKSRYRGEPKWALS